jgi:hypothetical protein
MNKLIVFLLIVITIDCNADGMVVDKVYHPNVLANEREVEWRLMSTQAENGNKLAQRLGYGQAISENVALEAYIIGERDQEDNFELQAFEIEARWMLTEQGQYWADWGMLFEFEKQHRVDNYEITSGILVEKEFARTSLTINFFVISEWGETLKSELETEFRIQYRYRYLPEVQPSIELYAGEDFVGIGPGLMGVHRFNGVKQLKWEAGFITEIAHSGKNHSLRFAIEYEF